MCGAMSAQIDRTRMHVHVVCNRLHDDDDDYGAFSGCENVQLASAESPTAAV